MVAKILKEVEDVAGQYSGLCRKALDWGNTLNRLIDESKLDDFDVARWDELSEFVDVERFLRTGTLKEEMRSADFVTFMRGWAPTAEWAGSFKRVTEHDNVVVLELEERVRVEGVSNSVNTILVYEFNERGKIKYMDDYMQAAPASPS